MLEQIEAIVADIKAIPSESPAETLWRKIAALVPANCWPHKRKTGWRRTGYADCNANGINESIYNSFRGVRIGDYSSAVCTVGGQNSGDYRHDADDDDVLFFGSDGRIYEIASVAGSWSQWQGSSSAYEIGWCVYRGDASNCIDDAIQVLAEHLAKKRDELRSKHQGSAYVSEMLAKLS